VRGDLETPPQWAIEAGDIAGSQAQQGVLASVAREQRADGAGDPIHAGHGQCRQQQACRPRRRHVDVLAGLHLAGDALRRPREQMVTRQDLA
jgi:hypothetical protein